MHTYNVKRQSERVCLKVYHMYLNLASGHNVQYRVSMAVVNLGWVNSYLE